MYSDLPPPTRKHPHCAHGSRVSPLHPRVCAWGDSQLGGLLAVEAQEMRLDVVPRPLALTRARVRAGIDSFEGGIWVEHMGSIGACRRFASCGWGWRRASSASGESGCDVRGCLTWDRKGSCTRRWPPGGQRPVPCELVSGERGHHNVSTSIAAPVRPLGISTGWRRRDDLRGTS